MPSRLQHRPIRPCNCQACPRRRRCRCRTCTDNRRRSPSPSPTTPSTRPPPCACARPPWSSRGTFRAVAGAPARWPGSAGSWCGGSQSPGSSGCPAARAALRPRASGSARHPTSKKKELILTVVVATGLEVKLLGVGRGGPPVGG